MKPIFHHPWGSCVIGVAVYLMRIPSSPAQPNRQVIELDQVQELIRSGTTSDQIIIQRIAHRLDALAGSNDRSSIGEIGGLIYLAAFIPDQPDPLTLENARNKRRAQLAEFSNAPYPEELDGRAFLYLAAGKMGLPVDQARTLRFAKDKNNPPSLRSLAVDAVLNQDRISPEIEGDLIALSKDDWHYLVPVGIGLPTAMTYPIREKAVQAMKKMKGETVGDHEGEEPSRQVIPDGLKPSLKPGEQEKDAGPAVLNPAEKTLPPSAVRRHRWMWLLGIPIVWGVAKWIANSRVRSP